MFYEQKKPIKRALIQDQNRNEKFPTHQIEKRSIILGIGSNERNDQQRRVIAGYTVELGKQKILK
jgi:hypothetical protein